MAASQLASADVSVKDRRLTLQPLGGSAVHALRDFVRARGDNAAALTFSEEQTAEGAFVGVVEVQGVLEPVRLDEADAAETRKSAREQVAAKALAMWNVEAGATDKADSNSGDDSETDPRLGDEAKNLVLNLIDCPGHLDFNSEVTAALRNSDSAILVVDVVEGVTVQTKRVLAQAVTDGLKPMLILNKVDRLFLELQLKAPQSAKRILEVLHQVNSLLEEPVSLADGSAILASGYFGWGVSVPTLLRQFVDEEKADMPEDERAAAFQDLLRRLRKVEGHRLTDSPILARGVVRHLTRLHKAASTQDVDTLGTIFGSEARALLAANVEDARADNMWKKVFRACMRKDLPAAEALLEMILLHGVAPEEGQRRRLRSLTGLSKVAAAPSTSKEWAAQQIAAARRDGPALVYFTKFVPLPGSGSKPKLAALGRVFSGTLRRGDNVRLLLSEEEGGGWRDIKIKGQHFVTGPTTVRDVQEASVGDVVLVSGVTSDFIKTATLVPANWAPLEATEPHVDMFVPLAFAVSPMVSAAVRPARPSDFQKLQTALKTLARIDPRVMVKFDEETKETSVFAAGELHLEVSIQSLRELAGIEIRDEPPRVTFRETIEAKAGQELVASGIPDLSQAGPGSLGKSANKLNRFWFHAVPLSDDLVAALEGSDAADAAQLRQLDDMLASQGWNSRDARRVWAIGSGDGNSNVGCNILVDATFGSSDLSPVRDSVVQAFQQVISAGPICGERVRGVGFFLTEATIHQDPPHRSPVQVVPACVRAMKASMLAAGSPDSALKMLEPKFNVTIEWSGDMLDGAVYDIIGQRDGIVVDVSENVLEADVPATKSFGMAAEMQHSTKGQISPVLQVDGWMSVPGVVGTGSPSAQESAVEKLVASLRTERGLEGWVPTSQDLADKL
mmetsp:Transcript_13210/g.49002  ORF Transcript_13210/g.49002 Transcript_13210/m.49002 type:complete len:903 (-) Transcript_13210:229-2937(-)